MRHTHAGRRASHARFDTSWTMLSQAWVCKTAGVGVEHFEGPARVFEREQAAMAALENGDIVLFNDRYYEIDNVVQEQLLGGHAVCIVGYNDNLAGGRFIVRNSWGTSWADRGYFYMPYSVIQNTSMSSDFWTISGVVNP